ncbi:MAG: hypothetical protein AVDCRST_MAG38-246 [uncultured Solirubrobacteraceae bacterium]|uniref:Uncharacterized protein n=1 Tax=uncultured Solirubrobacteraceae bacterium TaxID=1162706 RepID=A0A6J4R2L9_9ACTN|nr:MAG: hypothetical protein AVDCRST_MAG38-246 [uncultured Solirubrobacteraceae bacterium]
MGVFYSFAARLSTPLRCGCSPVIPRAMADGRSLSMEASVPATTRRGESWVPEIRHD